MTIMKFVKSANICNLGNATAATGDITWDRHNLIIMTHMHRGNNNLTTISQYRLMAVSRWAHSVSNWQSAYHPLFSLEYDMNVRIHTNQCTKLNKIHSLQADGGICVDLCTHVGPPLVSLESTFNSSSISQAEKKKLALYIASRLPLLEHGTILQALTCSCS